MNNELDLEVFRSGDYGPKGRWTDEALDQIAADYNSAIHEAPVTLDHAQTGPALGWVAGLKRSGDRLVARLRDVNEDLMALLRKGAFKKRSVEIYRQLPETTKPYLKAVSFLGAAAPAVKGLRDVLFGEGASLILFGAGLGDHNAFEFEAEAALEEGTEFSPATSFEARELFAERFSELKMGLRRDGRWIPTWEAQGIEEFCAALATLDEIQVRPGQFVHPSEWFSQFLRALPAYLPMGEAAPPAERRGRASIPTGTAVSQDSIELHRRVVAMRDARPELSYSQALRECASLRDRA